MNKITCSLLKDEQGKMETGKETNRKRKRRKQSPRNVSEFESRMQTGRSPEFLILPFRQKGRICIVKCRLDPNKEEKRRHEL